MTSFVKVLGGSGGVGELDRYQEGCVLTALSLFPRAKAGCACRLARLLRTSLGGTGCVDLLTITHITSAI